VTLFAFPAFARAVTPLFVLTLAGMCADANAQDASNEPLHAANVQADVARIWSTPGNRKLTIILPPYGGDHNYYNSSRLPAHLASHGIDFAVLYTETTGFNRAWDIDRLDALIAGVIAKGDYHPDKVVLGGFSAGGYGAFRYALRGLRGEKVALRPAALISVDAPLDIARWYRAMSLASRRMNDQNPFRGEFDYLTRMFREMLGGTPDEKPDAYREQSVLTASLPDGGNAAYFKRVPMRLYSEPDMDFYVPYGLDYAAINATDQVSLASILHSQGNTNVSLILTTGKGYRADMAGARMPHSWSIVDEAELARWIAARLECIGAGCRDRTRDPLITKWRG
jgi:pimeloyl-ACP methyl ester carboxylesterase